MSEQSTGGTCYECGNKISKPAVTVHRGRGPNLQFFTFACHTDWSFSRSLEIVKRSLQPGSD